MNKNSHDKILKTKHKILKTKLEDQYLSPVPMPYLLLVY